MQKTLFHVMSTAKKPFTFTTQPRFWQLVREGAGNENKKALVDGTNARMSQNIP
jgi:hypothetical protein